MSGFIWFDSIVTLYMYSFIFYSILLYSIILYSVSFYYILHHSIIFHSILSYSIPFFYIFYFILNTIFHSFLPYSVPIYHIPFHSYILFHSTILYSIPLYSIPPVTCHITKTKHLLTLFILLILSFFIFPSFIYWLKMIEFSLLLFWWQYPVPCET